MSNQGLSQKLLDVQKRIGSVTKSSTNPHFKSKYANLNEVLEVAKHALNEAGLFIAQAPGFDVNGGSCVRYVETSIIDSETGQQISGKIAFSGNEDNMQKIGAAITYARRFGLVSLLALEQDDDDGEMTVGRGNSGPARSSQAENIQRMGTARPAAQPTSGNGRFISNAPSRKESAPLAQKVPEKSSRETTLRLITETSKVIVDSKRDTQDNIMKLLGPYGVLTKEELTDSQAAQLLKELEAKLN